MSLLQIHLYFIGIPLLLVVTLAAMIWSHKGPHPATYKLPEEWARPPILWAAVGEDVGHAHHGHGPSEFTVGGGASGTW